MWPGEAEIGFANDGIARLGWQFCRHTIATFPAEDGAIWVCLKEVQRTPLHAMPDHDPEHGPRVFTGNHNVVVRKTVLTARIQPRTNPLSSYVATG